jgi:hypothetical protein
MNSAVSAHRRAVRSDTAKLEEAGAAPAVPIEDVVTIEPSQAMLDD